MLAVVGGSLTYFRRQAHPTRSGGTTATRKLDLGEQNGRIAYGTAAKDVLATLGSPSSRQAGCWIYRAKAHIVNGEYLGDAVDALRYCFGPGPAGGTVVTVISEHLVAHRLPNKKWFPGGWGMMTLLARPKTNPY